MDAACRGRLSEQGFGADQILTEHYLHMRYEGTDCALMVARPCAVQGDYLDSFLERYKSEFGFTIPAKAVLVDDIRVRGVGKYVTADEPDLPVANGDPSEEKVSNVHPTRGRRYISYNTGLALFNGGFR